jgi:hypothetical protein
MSIDSTLASLPTGAELLTAPETGPAPASPAASRTKVGSIETIRFRMTDSFHHDDYAIVRNEPSGVFPANRRGHRDRMTAVDEVGDLWGNAVVVGTEPNL